MGQSPSQEAQPGATGEPEPFVLHQSVQKMARKPLIHLANSSNMKYAAKPPKAKPKNDDKSESDEDGESDWSDWNAKANRGVKRTSTSAGNLGPSTYETTSGAEGEDDSGGEEQRSSADHTPPVREGSQELGYIGSPGRSPTHVEDGDARAGKRKGAIRSPTLKNAFGDGSVSMSDGSPDSFEESDSGAPVKAVESAEHLHEEPVLHTRAQKTDSSPDEQLLRLEGTFEPDSPESERDTQHDEDMVPVRTTTSDQDTSSSSSIFDIVQDAALVDSNLLQNPILKRTRRRTGGRVSGPEEQPTRKRRKRSIFSPPTSVSAEDQEVPRSPLPGRKAIQGRFKINRPVMKPKLAFNQVGQDQGSVTAWVKPLSLGSSLKHPLFNPSPLKNLLRGRAADVAGQITEANVPSADVAPRRFARKSGNDVDNFAPTVEDTDYDEGPSLVKKSKQILPTPKGKRKAEPGVEYSLPSDARTRTAEFRSNEKSRGKRKPRIPNTFASENIAEEETEQQRTDSSGAGSNINLSEAETADQAEEPSATKELACKTCRRRFRHKNQLQTHKSNNRACVKLYQCWKCCKEFDDKRLLLRHQSQKRHPRETFHTQRTGPFSEIEKLKLERFMTDYCDNHGIDETVFRQMMTDSSRRGGNATWSWPGVTRFAFLNEYFDVLPDRAHKSMQRYKERYFQNLDHNKEWTKEDDKLLLDLVNEVGPKWTEIGLRLNRTQDSVTQRYKNKLKNGDIAQSGLWSSRESNALATAVREIKDELGLAETTDTDESIPWGEISKRIGGIRTSHQCSTHWRRVHRRKHESRRPSGRMGRKVKSKEFVSSDSDEERSDVKDDRGRERFTDVLIPNIPSKKPSHAKPEYSSEFDSHRVSIDQDSERVEGRPDPAARVRLSPRLESSDYDEQNGRLSPISSHTDTFTDPPERHDSPNEPVMATADEWERILEAEGQTLPPLAATNIEDGVPDILGVQDSQEAETDEDLPIISPARRTGRIANNEVSPNPLLKKTPGKVMDLSQVFNETQAPTSILRPLGPNGLEILVPTSSRPSPDIGLKLRPDFSQDLRTSYRQLVRRKSGPMADGYQRVYRQEIGELGDHGGDRDTDTNMEGAEEVQRGGEMHYEISSTTSQESEAEYSEQGDEQDADRPAFTSGVIADRGTALADGDAEEREDDTSGESDESEEEYKSGEELSKSESESVVSASSDEDDENEDSNDSMVKDTHNDFMANIKESAEYMSQLTPVASRKIMEESDDDSD